MAGRSTSRQPIFHRSTSCRLTSHGTSVANAGCGKWGGEQDLRLLTSYVRHLLLGCRLTFDSGVRCAVMVEHFLLSVISADMPTVPFVSLAWLPLIRTSSKPWNTAALPVTGGDSCSMYVLCYLPIAAFDHKYYYPGFVAGRCPFLPSGDED